MSEHTISGPADKSNNVAVTDLIQYRVELVEPDGRVSAHVLAADEAAAEQMRAAFQAIGAVSPSHPHVEVTPLHSQVPVLAGGAG